MCGCSANKVINNAAVTSFASDGVLTYSSKENNCNDLTRVFSLIKARDHYLNNNTLPDGVELDELITLVNIATHVVNTNNWCGFADKINEYYEKLGAKDFE